MREYEAIREIVWIRYELMQTNNINKDRMDAINEAIKALQDIVEYRKIENRRLINKESVDDIVEQLEEKLEKPRDHKKCPSHPVIF